MRARWGVTTALGSSTSACTQILGKLLLYCIRRGSHWAEAMTTEFAAIRKELKGLGVRNSFRGATKNYMAELLNRRKHNTGVVPPQLLTAEALRMARGTEYRELLGKPKRSLRITTRSSAGCIRSQPLRARKAYGCTLPPRRPV